MIQNSFFQLLQVALGIRRQLSCVLSLAEWNVVMDMAHKQALIGIMFDAIQQLPQEQWPPSTLVLKWTMAAEHIKQRNALTTNVSLRLTNILTDNGFEVCILKGQCNHVYYDALTANSRLGLLRICGDIDAWIWPVQSCKHPVKTIIDFCQQKHILLSLCHLHAEVKPIQGVPIEIHFHPSFLNAPWHDRAFQRIFRKAKFVKANIDGYGELQKLRVDYDLIFQLTHIYRHLLDEGVGLRQVLDFYVLLKYYNQQALTTEADNMMSKSKVMSKIAHCGMARFVSALMYVMQEIFAMPDAELLCPASKKHGEFLLSEMMQAGNFGHYDQRMAHIEVKKGKLSYQLQKARRRFARNLRFFTSYPTEVACEPVARILHTLWRKYRLYRIGRCLNLKIN